jgi:hypothetical protein
VIHRPPGNVIRPSISRAISGKQACEESGRTVLSIIRPTVAMQMVDNAELQKVAEEVEGKLKKAFDAVK